MASEEGEVAKEMFGYLNDLFNNIDSARSNHKLADKAQLGSKEKREFLKKKKNNLDICDKSLDYLVVKTGKKSGGLKLTYSITKGRSAKSAKFFQDVIKIPKGPLGTAQMKAMKIYLKGTIDVMKVKFEKDMHEWAVQNSTKVPDEEYPTFVRELAVHLSRQYSGQFLKHTKLGKEFFDSRNKKAGKC